MNLFVSYLSVHKLSSKQFIVILNAKNGFSKSTLVVVKARDEIFAIAIEISSPKHVNLIQ